MMLRAAVQRALDLARSRPQAPTVQFTPKNVRGGNILYYWQWAYLGRAQDQRRSILETEHMPQWTQEFPALADLTISRSAVNLLDQRTFATRHHYGTSFTTQENQDFCRWVLDRSPHFGQRLEQARKTIGDDTCVVNVRRGDYYSVPEFRAEFGMDIRSHIAESIEILEDQGRLSDDLLIVSDDPGWCRSHLSDVLPSTPRFLTGRVSMFDDLAALASARTLVLSNSTFAYWGSFFASSLQADHLAIAPPFHQRTGAGGLVEDLFSPDWPRTGTSAA
ncbi:alpha-1,2-fucosyltransferase [Microbacterium sp.]|uniref:alpha-1,2-fucosyltransferase n=1 Tax=Microbacterium sp. TaxID=51671 RepID=UPI003F960A7E